MKSLAQYFCLAWMARLRSIIVDVSRKHGLAPIAASTHPFGSATRQMPTEKEQFFALAREMQAAARSMLCLRPLRLRPP